MDRAWIVCVTLMASYLVVSAQRCNRDDNSLCIHKNNCTVDCERRKCTSYNGICMSKDEEALCYERYGSDSSWVGDGRGCWCKFHRKCKCCIPAPTTTQATTTPNCDPQCDHGDCTAPNVCTCWPGWTGPLCEFPICDPPCVHGKCIGPNECQCDPGWEGPTCEEPICNPQCQNGGTCVAPPDVCECAPGWQGDFCDVPICNPVCENGGTCTDPDVCTCTEAYYGPVCQYIFCENRINCNNKSGTCWAKNHPIFDNKTLCPQQDNGRNWCTPMCACCFGA